MKIIAGILGGLIIAIIGAAFVTTAFAASPEKGGSWGGMSFLIFWVVGIAVAILAKSASKAWRRLFLTAAVLSFLLPLSGVIYTGSFIANVDSADKYASAAATAGATVGGGLVSGFLGFVGFFLGVVFLIIGLLVGRDKQIVYVQAPPPASLGK